MLFNKTETEKYFPTRIFYLRMSFFLTFTPLAGAVFSHIFVNRCLLEVVEVALFLLNHHQADTQLSLSDVSGLVSCARECKVMATLYHQYCDMTHVL